MNFINLVDFFFGLARTEKKKNGDGERRRETERERRQKRATESERHAAHAITSSGQRAIERARQAYTEENARRTRGAAAGTCVKQARARTKRVPDVLARAHTSHSSCSLAPATCARRSAPHVPPLLRPQLHSGHHVVFTFYFFKQALS